jgi:hypothetical protein
VASARATRSGDLEQGVTSTAAVLRQLAAHRRELDDILRRAPSTLRRSALTLGRARGALKVVPASLPLVRVLRALGPTSRKTLPLVSDLRSTLPLLRRTLLTIPGLAKRVIPLVRQSTVTARRSLPVYSALRPYGPDFLNGFFNGVGGAIAGYYDANGNYVRIASVGGSGSGAGLGTLVTPPSTPLTNYRTGLLARCPGAAITPAPDGSNPWVDNRKLCDPSEDPP